MAGEAPGKEDESSEWDKKISFLSGLAFGNVSYKVCKILHVFEYTGQSNKRSEERQMNTLLTELIFKQM